MGKGHCWSSK